MLTPIVIFTLLAAKKHVFAPIKTEKFFHRTVKGREWNPDSVFPEPPKDAPKVKKIN